MKSLDSGRSSQSEQEGKNRSFASGLARNPVCQSLILMIVISLLSWSVAPGRISDVFVVSPPVGEPWYELLLANYSHLNSAHLFSNALIIAIAGGIISISSSMLRFHVFFITTGVISIASQVILSGMFGFPISVLGSSGAGFALIGYLITSNPVSISVLKITSTRVVAILLLLIGGVVTILYSAPGSAIFSHFVGVSLGLVAGRLRLLKSE